MGVLIPLSAVPLVAGQFEAVNQGQAFERVAQFEVITIDHVGRLVFNLTAHINDLHKIVALSLALVGADNAISCNAAIYDQLNSKYVCDYRQKCMIKKDGDDVPLALLVRDKTNANLIDGQLTVDAKAWLNNYAICITDVVTAGWYYFGYYGWVQRRSFAFTKFRLILCEFRQFPCCIAKIFQLLEKENP